MSPFARLSIRICTLLLIFLGSGCMSPTARIPQLHSELISQEALSQNCDFLLAESQRSTRILNTAFPILKAAAELFPAHYRYTLGISLQSDSVIEAPYRQAALTLWGDQPSLRISAVAHNAPAGIAGIQVNDRLLAINEISALNDLSQSIHLLHKALAHGNPITLTLEREGQNITLPITPVKTADYRVRLRHKASINARATTKQVEINRGMLEFCQNDSELAYVIAHEIAHIALKHHRDAAINFLTGLIGDAALWATLIPSPGIIATTTLAAKSESYEIEADYIALYLLVRAGYAPEEAAQFWQRLATIVPIQKSRFKLNFKSHPDLPTRQILFEQTLNEIQNNPHLKPLFKSR